MGQCGTRETKLLLFISYIRACLKCDKDYNYGDIFLANQKTCRENNLVPYPWLFTEKNTHLDCATLLHKDTRYCERYVIHDIVFN